MYLKTMHPKQFFTLKIKGIIRDENNLDTDPRVWNFKDE